MTIAIAMRTFFARRSNLFSASAETASQSSLAVTGVFGFRFGLNGVLLP